VVPSVRASARKRAPWGGRIRISGAKRASKRTQASTLGRKAIGLRSRVVPMAVWRSISKRGLLWHERQLHCSTYTHV